MVGKRGQGLKYDILISAILGILVIGLSLYFIFHEYFTEDDADREICRQSIVLRAQAIEKGGDILEWSGTKLAEGLPFKCKNEVINIDYFDEEKLKKEIADSSLACNYLYLEGKRPLYSKSLSTKGTYCFICSRIHIEESVTDKYSESEIKIGEYIVGKKLVDGKSYFDILYGTENKYLDEFRQKILKDTIKPTQGDIIVAFFYVNAPEYSFDTDFLDYPFFISKFLANWFFGDKYYSGGVRYFQPNVNQEILEKCTVVETIPA